MKLASLTGAGALFLSLLSPTAAKAETSHTCTGFIRSIPATITTQGTWCLSQDVATSMRAGIAIDIQVNNVAIDCNGFKIGGLAAGDATTATGIAALSRKNIYIRNCLVRGFRKGIDLTGLVSSGHLVENNRLDQNTHIGIAIEGGGSVLRRNVITDTGTGKTATWAHALQVGENVDVIDNLIDGVQPGTGADGRTPLATGIHLYATGSVVRENRIRNVTSNGLGPSYAIFGTGAGLNRAVDNDLFGMLEPGSYGAFCMAANNVSLTNNYIGAFATGFRTCNNDRGNAVR